jgi:hypothetical protein
MSSFNHVPSELSIQSAISKDMKLGLHQTNGVIIMMPDEKVSFNIREKERPDVFYP